MTTDLPECSHLEPKHLNIIALLRYCNILIYMAKTNIETKDGTKITIEGTPEEVSRIVALYQTPVEKRPQKEFKKFEKGNAKLTVTDIARELIVEGFFNKPTGLAELKQGLEEQGHFIPITTLSGVVLSLVKSRELRRIKKEKRWTYVQR